MQTRHGSHTRMAPRAGRIDGDEIVSLPFADVGDLLASGTTGPPGPAPTARAGRWMGADLAPVVPRPSKVFCVGLNYLRHVQEAGGRFPPIRPCSPSSPTP